MPYPPLIPTITRVDTIDNWRIQTNQTANTVNYMANNDFVKPNGTLHLTETAKLVITANGTALQVANDVLFQSNVTVGKDVLATGNGRFGATVTITGAGESLNVTNSAFVAANVTVGGTVNANSVVVKTNVTSANIVVTDRATVNNISVLGNAQIAGNVTVIGDIIANTISGNVSTLLVTTVNVSTTNVTTNVVMANTITTANLTVTNNTTTGNLAVTNAATVGTLNKVTVTAPTVNATMTLANGSSFITVGAFSLSVVSSADTVATMPPGTSNIGTREILQNSQSGNYKTLLSDSGKQVYHPTSDTTARVWTIDTVANTGYTLGAAITFINDAGAGVISLTPNTGVTLIWSPSGTSGTRNLSANGMATAVMVVNNRWFIGGSGLS